LGLGFEVLCSGPQDIARFDENGNRLNLQTLSERSCRQWQDGQKSAECNFAAITQRFPGSVEQRESAELIPPFIEANEARNPVFTNSNCLHFAVLLEGSQPLT